MPNSVVMNGVQGGRPGELGPEGFPVAAHLRAGLLRRRDDAHCRAQIRHGQVCPSLAMPSVILYFAAVWIGTDNVLNKDGGDGGDEIGTFAKSLL